MFALAVTAAVRAGAPASVPGWALHSRIVYFLGYVAQASRRSPGFFIQAAAVAVLLFGALGRIIYLAVTSAM